MKKFISKIKTAVPDLKVPDINIPGISPALELGETLFGKVLGTLDDGVGVLKSTMGGIPFLGKTASSASYDHEKIDERHYFLVPDPSDPEKFSLCITRCLPDDVPPINDLPKRRLLHLPSEHALPMLEDIVLKEASDAIKAEEIEPGMLVRNLSGLLDEIDKVDDKAFQGLLLVGGLVALANPLAGAAVAAKAAVPAMAVVLSKYGLKVATDTASNVEIARKIKKAEKDLKKQFSQSGTSMVINPLLASLGDSTSVESWLMEKKRFTFVCDDYEFTSADLIRLMDLTEAAIKVSCETKIDKAYYETMRERVLWRD